MSDNKMSEIIRASVEGLKSSFDANTIIGEAITTANGTVVIPVSKLSVGFATGGIDYLGKKAAPTGNNNFGGGGGSGLSVNPVAFLVISPAGTVELLNVNESKEPADAVSQIINAIERSPELIEKFKEVFSKNK
ncbi:putative spore protein YtfJ [Clostridiales bacterium]|nr:sporulation protein YtfJ [Clostridiales bacterium]GFI55329.1 putative spore protein YtfJ [Clostridiales bacterium]